MDQVPHGLFIQIMALARPKRFKTRVAAERYARKVRAKRIYWADKRGGNLKSEEIRNPKMNNSGVAKSLPRNVWLDTKAMITPSGKVKLKVPLTAGIRRNIAQGYYDGTGFHPIRASADYDPDRAGDSYSQRAKPKRKPKAKAKAKRKAPKRKAAKRR